MNRISAQGEEGVATEAESEPVTMTETIECVIAEWWSSEDELDSDKLAENIAIALTHSAEGEGAATEAEPPPYALFAYLREMRVAAGLSLREVAAGISVSNVYLGEIERGVRRCDADHFSRLVETIPGVTLQRLRALSEAEPELADHWPKEKVRVVKGRVVSKETRPGMLLVGDDDETEAEPVAWGTHDPSPEWDGLSEIALNASDLNVLDGEVVVPLFTHPPGETDG